MINNSQKTPLYPLYLGCLLGLGIWLNSDATAAATPVAAGTIQNITGAVSINRADGSSASASPQMAIYEGDAIKTDRGGEATLIMGDQSAYTIYHDSQWVVKAYRYEEANPDKDRSLIELITGKFRFVTGLMGKRNAKKVQYTSGVATMGIRGTAGTIGQVNNHYEVIVTEGEVIVICAHPSCTRQGEFSVVAGKSAYFKLTDDGQFKHIPVQDYWKAVQSFSWLQLPDPAQESIASPH